MTKFVVVVLAMMWAWLMLVEKRLRELQEDEENREEEEG